MPNGKYAPCCAWGGNSFDSREQMTAEVGGAFLRGEVPAQCAGSCSPDQLGWRSVFDEYATDFASHKIQFLDFRNNNLCNMKCRSCGPGFSTSWASEAKLTEIKLHDPVPVNTVDLTACKKVYFAGGEPLLNPQHYEVLDSLIAQGSDPVLMYSTNLSVLSYKDRSVKDLWPQFSKINVHASIDAVGPYAEVVRSGTVWNDIEQNLSWVRTQANCHIRIATVLSAINIWFLPHLLKYIDWLEEPHTFEPVLANPNSVIGLNSIPTQYRADLIDMLIDSRYNTCINVAKAIDILQQNNYNESNWHKFLAQQMILDHYRGESWFNLLPIRHNVYREVLHIG